MSAIYFIRHGQASFGKDNYDKLSELGRRQSRLLAGYLDAMDIRFDVIYTGTLTRHLETAEEYLAHCRQQGIPLPAVKQTPDLNEFNSREILTALVPVLLERDPLMQVHLDRLLTDRRSFQKVFEAVIKMWTSKSYENAGIPSWKDFLSAVGRGVDAIAAADGRGRKIGVVTSGGPIAAAIQRVLQIPDDRAMQMGMQLVNSSFTRFRCTDRQITITSFNEYPHLEAGKDRNLITYR